MTVPEWQRIADVIHAEASITRNNSEAQRAVQNVMYSLADSFVRNNPDFIRSDFYRACGFGLMGRTFVS